MTFNPPQILSAGVGVQTIALAQLSIDGHLPPLDCAIFADTGWEPQHVYDQLAHMSDALAAVGVPVHVVSNGNIRKDALSGGRFASMPMHMKGPAGNGMAMRQCTEEYKLTPLKRKVREILGAKPSVTKSGKPSMGRVPGSPGQRYVSMWVGISTDEIQRKKPSDVSYIQRIDPLIDILDMTRDDCKEYLAERWPYPVERSACIGCPFHDNEEWRNMRDEDPTSFADAVDFDVQIRSRSLGSLKSQPFIHSDRVPLSEADLSKLTKREQAARQDSLFTPAQRSCSPWGCRSESAAAR